MSRISVIIPTLNEEDNIGNLLSDLTKQTQKPYEIIVVDGKSTDKTKAIVKRFQQVTLLTTNPLPAGQRSIGGKKATGNILLFLDADVRISRDFLKKIRDEFQRKQCGIACPYYLPYHSTRAIKFVYYFFNAHFFLWQKLAPSGAGSCICVTKDVFDRIHGFDQHLRYDDIAFIRNAGKISTFHMLPFSILVSDRRFHKEGYWKTTMRYIFLGFFFATNNFKQANTIPYAFNHYKEKN